MAGREQRSQATARQLPTRQAPPQPWLGMPPALGQCLTAMIVLSLTGWIIYGRALHYPFFFDDIHAVVLNPSITSLWPWTGDSSPLVAEFDSPTAGRPLVNLSLAVNYHFGQLDPFGYHIFNLTVHVLSSLLLWGIVRRTLQLPCFGNRFDQGGWLLALFVATAWLAHPLQTEAVEYTTQRTELMMAFFYLATLYASLRYMNATKRIQRSAWLTAAGGACLLGMTCKEVMVTAPLVVLLYDRTFLAGSFGQAWRRSWPLYLVLSLTWLALLALNISGPRTDSAGFNLGVPAHVWWFTQAKVLAIYLKLVFWPWPLTIHYRVPYLETVAAAWPWLALMGTLGISALVLLGRGAAAGFLGACVFLILSPTIVVPVVKEIAVERRMYLPLAAILTLVIVGAYWCAQSVLRAAAPDADAKNDDRRPLALVILPAAVLVVAMGVVSAIRLTAYQDAVTIWQDAALRDPDDAMAVNNAGRALNDAHRYDEALEYMRQFVQRAPDSAEGHHVLALVLLNLNRSAEAIEHLQKALHGPDAALAHYHFGIALTNLGRPGEAVEHFEVVAQEQPDVAEIQNRLGMALTLAGKPAAAIDHFRRALRLTPDSPVVHANLGLALKQAGQLAEAARAFEAAVRLAPDNLEPRTQLAMVYADLGRTDDALAMAESTLIMAKTSGNAAQAQILETWLRDHRKKE